MKDQWYCGVDGQQYGPYTWEQLRAMAAQGQLVSQTYVRREADQQWLSAAQMPGLLPRKKAVAKSSHSSVKVAKPAAAAAVASLPANIPVGRAVEQPMPAAEPEPPPKFFMDAKAAIQSDPAAAEDAPAPKSASPLLLVGILGGAVALVALVGIGLAVWSFSRTKRPPATDLASALDKAGAEMEMQLVELNPNESLSEMARQALGDPPAAPAKASPQSLVAAKKIVASQGKWTNLLRFSQLKINGVSLQVMSVWLASDAAGTRVEPVPLAANAAASAAPPAKYVFVELRVANGGTVARRYSSWNAAAATSAVLADQTGQVLAPVPPADTPGIQRLSSVQLAPGDAVLDVLVFEAPSGPFESLKLALAKTSLVSGAKGHLALEVPLEVLLRQRAAGAEGEATQPIALKAAEQPADVVAATAEPVSAGGDATPSRPRKRRPPTTEELNKQFEQFDKDTKSGDAKNGDKGVEPKTS